MPIRRFHLEVRIFMLQLLIMYRHPLGWQLSLFLVHQTWLCNQCVRFVSQCIWSFNVYSFSVLVQELLSALAAQKQPGNNFHAVSHLCCHHASIQDMTLSRSQDSRHLIIRDSSICKMGVGAVLNLLETYQILATWVSTCLVRPAGFHNFRLATQATRTAMATRKTKAAGRTAKGPSPKSK